MFLNKKRTLRTKISETIHEKHYFQEIKETIDKNYSGQKKTFPRCFSKGKHKDVQY